MDSFFDFDKDGELDAIERGLEYEFLEEMSEEEEMDFEDNEDYDEEGCEDEEYDDFYDED